TSENSLDTACSSFIEMSRFALGMLAGSSWDCGASLAPNNTGDIEHARTRHVDLHPSLNHR
ncbi:hypothetical protein, partial [Burkholderia glumae]|uniref:hypothetical protein n=1 Tax=Burkholderia glumae TaxID=337 RepID=UPI0019D6E110